MKDEFKRVSFKDMGFGGIDCPCCCDLPKKRKNHKKLLRRLTRRRMKNKFLKFLNKHF
jgi:hypothetical protein